MYLDSELPLRERGFAKSLVGFLSNLVGDLATDLALWPMECVGHASDHLAVLVTIRRHGTKKRPDFIQAFLVTIST